MKHNEFMRLEEKCPKCQSDLMLQKTSWSEVSGGLQYVFCEPCKCKGNGAVIGKNGQDHTRLLIGSARRRLR